MKRILSLVLICLMCFSLLPYSTVEAEQSPELPIIIEPVNPELADYLSRQSSPGMRAYGTDEGGASSGYIPPPVVYTQTPADLIYAPSTGAAKYDPRTDNNANITPVKDQQSLGVCWAFSGLGALESYIKLKQGSVTDWSENHLRHAVSNNGGNALGFVRSNDGGGNANMVAAYYMRQSTGGPVLDSSDPYVNNATARAVAETAAKTRTGKVTGMVWIPDLTSGTAGTSSAYRTQIKQAIQDYGAVAISYASTGSTSAAGQSGASYYTTESTSNHGVVIVGWDDNYAVSNFSSPQPSGAGAWLVKNSWGSSWGDGQGYFWMSYYTPIKSVNAVTGYQSSFSDGIFDYAPFGQTASAGYGASVTTLYYGNIFDCADASAQLKQVTFHNPNANTSYSVHVYTSNGESDTAMLTKAVSTAAVATGSTTHPGYYTVDISPLAVANKSFAVVIKVSGAANLGAPLEATVTGYCTATAKTGQSYMGYTGSNWNDTSSTGNVDIKAIVSGSAGGTDLTRNPPKSGGSGTVSDPFLVSDAATLKKVGSGTDDWTLSAHYKQTANIDMTGQSFTPIGPASWSPFGGIYDGGLYTISNLTVTSSTDNGFAGMFGSIGGTVKNLALVNVSITASGNSAAAGGIAGGCSGTIQNCYVTGSIKSIGANGIAGGIVGEIQYTTVSMVQNCYTTTYVLGTQVGGIAGTNADTLRNCVALNTAILSFAGSLKRIANGNGAKFSNNYGGILTETIDIRISVGTDGTGGNPIGAIPDLNGNGGADLDAPDAVKEAWWKDANNWNTSGGASAWDFANIWMIKSGTNNGYPILRTPGLVSGGDINPGTPADAVIVPSNASGAYINLTDETITLPDDFTVAAYSLDGGTKWKKGALPADAKFQKLLDKGMTLWLSDGWNDKKVIEDKKVVAEKGVPKGAAIIKFAKINARPKSNTEKLAPYYPVKSDDIWVLAKKSDSTGKAVSKGYEYASSSNGKTPDETGWLMVSDSGFAILSGTAKSTYLVRSAPAGSGSSYTPASKPFKVKPANFGKAPNYKIKTAKDLNDKTKKIELIALKKGDAYAVGSDIFTSLSDKKELKVEALAKNGTVLLVKKAATGKKPRSEVQEISLPEPEAAEPDE